MRFHSWMIFPVLLLSPVLTASAHSHAVTLQPAEELHKVRVTILGRATSIRTGQSNEDIFLIEIVPKHGEPILGRLVDEFPYYQNGLPERLLESDAQFTLQMRRDVSCDTAAESMSFPGHLHAADLIAIDSSRSPALMGNATTGSSTLRCFSALHKTWKYVGHEKEADWWR